MERSLTIRFEKIVAIIVQLFLIMFLLLVDGVVSLEFLSKFSLINTIAVMAVMFKVGKCFFTTSSTFMLFLAVFHFGQAWLYVFGGEVDRKIAYDIFDLYRKDVVYDILLFSLLCYNLIALFWVAFHRKTKELDEKLSEQFKERIKLEKKTIFQFGIIFFFVLLIPVVIYDYLSITITAEFGHSGLYDNADQLSVWAAANSYLPLAIIMVLLGSDPKKNSWKWMYYYAVGRCVLLMILTGKRGSFIIPLLLYVFCKHRFIKKYEKKHFVWIVIAGIAMLALIPFVSYGRGDYSDINFLEFTRENNVITLILSELGSTFTTTVLSYNYADAFGFINGKSYLGALLVFLPFSNTIAPGIKEYMSVSALLNPYSPSGGALGGSFFGEMYINFGYYSLLLTPLFALLISKIESVISHSYKHSLFTVCSSIYISYGFWIYVRGNLVDVVFIVKRTLYVLIIFLILKALSARRSRKYEKGVINRI